MDSKNNFDSMFEFVPDNNSGFEDIVSDSSMKVDSDGTILFSSFSDKSKYAKKKHGFWGSISKWWKNRKAWQKASMITALSVILVFSIILTVFMTMFDYNYNSITGDHADLGIENVIDKDIVNVALFGIDTRSLDSFKGNSDSIMILSLNTKTKKVKIISVMRDSFVPITYNGITTYSKINSAYQKGGPELAIKTLNTVFGLDITEYATVNFYGMVDIIDAVGGIEAELTKAEVVGSKKNMYALNFCIDEICANLGIDASKNYITTPGVHHLNGVQAVAYSRIRYVANIWGTNNDYGRTDRQRYVMEQLFNKALALEKTQYIKLAKSLIPCSETSLSYTEILGLAFDILLKSPTFSQARMPQQEFIMTSPNTSAGSVVYYDLEYAKKIIHAFIYDDITFEDYIAQNGIEKNSWYKGGNRRPSTGNNTTSNNSSVNNPTEEEPDITDETSEPLEGEDTSEPTESEGDGTSSEPSQPEDGTSSEPTNPDEGDGNTSETPSEPTDSSSSETPPESENSSTDNSSDRGSSSQDGSQATAP